MDTGSVRMKVTAEGEFLTFISEEGISEDPLSVFADNYICYSHFFDLSKCVFFQGRLVKSQSEKIDISYLKSTRDYLEFGNHLPIPCFDFFIRTTRPTGNYYLLIKREFWPMHGHWWPVGGRRMLPGVEERVVNDWSYIDEVQRKLLDDLGLRATDIVAITKVATSDHYHLCYKDATRTRLRRRRVTPVTSFLIDIDCSKADWLKKPAKEASEIRWFSEGELMELLDSDMASISDHLRIIFGEIFQKDFCLRAKTAYLRQAG